MLKKILITLIVLIIIGLFGTAMFLFFRGVDEAPDNNGGLRSYLPFGRSNGGGETNIDTSFDIQYADQTEGTPESMPINESGTKETLKKIYDKPVAGIVTTNNLTRIVDRATGHIFEYNHTGGVLKRLTNKTIPGVEEALWNQNGDRVLLRYSTDNQTIKTEWISLQINSCPEFKNELKLGDNNSDVLDLQKFLNSYSASIVATSGVGSPGNENTSFGPATERALEIFQESANLDQTGILDEETRKTISEMCNQKTVDFVPIETGSLSDNIAEITISPFGNQIFYLVNNGSGVIGTIANYPNNNPKDIFESEMREWLISWVNEETVMLKTKGSEMASGYVYTYSLGNGKLERMGGGLSNFSASSGNNFILYTGTSLGSNPDRGEIVNITSKQRNPVSFYMHAEKCGFSNSDVLFCGVPLESKAIDLWHLGLESFTDTLMEIVATDDGLFIQNVFTPTISEFLDISRVSVSPNGKTASFINKNNLHAWLLQK